MLAERLRLLSDICKADRIVLHLVELEPHAMAYATFGAVSTARPAESGGTRRGSR